MNCAACNNPAVCMTGYASNVSWALCWDCLRERHREMADTPHGHGMVSVADLHVRIMEDGT